MARVDGASGQLAYPAALEADQSADLGRRPLRCACSRVNCVPPTFSLAEIQVLVGGAVPPALAVPVSTRVSDRMKRVGSTVYP